MYGFDEIDEMAYEFAMEQLADLAEGRIFDVWYENEEV
jgi:hypothetical protein